MYAAGFYPFPSEEARWGYWARHVWVNRHEPGALPLYRALRAFARERDSFVITTNVDAQFEKAGFPPERLFATQGDYGLLQCARGCHDALYPNRELVAQMLARTEDCLVPSDLVPACPVCGGPMAVHLRVDGHFVEDTAWRAAQERYHRFVAGHGPRACRAAGAGRGMEHAGHRPPPVRGAGPRDGSPARALELR